MASYCFASCQTVTRGKPRNQFLEKFSDTKIYAKTGISFCSPQMKKDGPEQPVNEIPRVSHGQYNPVVTKDKEYGRPMIERGYDAQFDEGQACESFRS